MVGTFIAHAWNGIDDSKKKKKSASSGKSSIWVGNYSIYSLIIIHSIGANDSSANRSNRSSISVAINFNLSSSISELATDLSTPEKG